MSNTFQRSSRRERLLPTGLLSFISQENRRMRRSIRTACAQFLAVCRFLPFWTPAHLKSPDPSRISYTNDCIFRVHTGRPSRSVLSASHRQRQERIARAMLLVHCQPAPSRSGGSRSKTTNRHGKKTNKSPRRFFSTCFAPHATHEQSSIPAATIPQQFLNNRSRTGFLLSHSGSFLHPSSFHYPTP